MNTNSTNTIKVKFVGTLITQTASRSINSTRFQLIVAETGPKRQTASKYVREFFFLPKMQKNSLKKVFKSFRLIARGNRPDDENVGYHTNF